MTNQNKVLTSLLILLSLSTSHATQFNCGTSQAADQLAQLIMDHPEQQRKKLVCSKKLIEIANIKAGHILEQQDVWHHAGRMAPNQLLRHHGFKLPKTYPMFGNQVEALAGGEEAVELVLSDFLASQPHRQLLLGGDEFFQLQDQMGVAYVSDLATEHQHYWVVIIADEHNNTVQQDPVIEVKPPVIAPKKRNRGREIKEKLYRDKVRTIQKF